MGYTTPIAEVQPHNIEAEQQLLGCILLANDSFHKVSDILADEHFFDPVHQRIYAACASRIRNSHPVDPVILRMQMEQDEGLRELGGRAYLVRMAAAAVAVSMVRHYAELIVDCFQRRLMLDAITTAKQAIIKGDDMQAVRAEIEVAGAKVAVADTKPPTVSMMTATSKALSFAHKAFMGEATGLITGIKSLDDLTGGFFPEDLVIIAGAPSMGKTAVALAMARAFGQATVGTCFVSLEMGDYSLAQRVLSSVADVPYRLMRRGVFSAEQGAALKQAADLIQYWPIEIVQGHVRDINAIYAAARRVQKQMESRVPGGLRVLIVDYLQLVRAAGKDRFQVVTEVSIGLKNIAKQMGIPVIALAQINAGKLADRDDKRPRLADIRESGQIEQDADMILFCHRDHYHLERGGPPRGKNGQVSTEAMVDFDAALKAAKHQIDIILAKHRHDGIGEVKLGCDMATNRLWDLDSGLSQEGMGFI